MNDNKSHYDQYPKIHVEGSYEAIEGYDSILGCFDQIDENACVVVECYPGVDDTLYQKLIETLKPTEVIESTQIFYEEDIMNEKMKLFLTEDRVRGIMYPGQMEDFIDYEKLAYAQEKLRKSSGRKLIYGVGASFITRGDLLIYADLTRWEIQLRYRDGMSNFNCSNSDEELLKKYKRGYFVEWRIADKLKRQLFDHIDYYIDINNSDKPIMVSFEVLKEAMKQVYDQPFRLVPYFDSGVWGGQWMQETFDLDPSSDNYAWCFDGVPEENSVQFCFKNSVLQMPAMNLVLYKPKKLLGEKNYARFGAEFPIRFDLLDTMGGQNLSLQVHPTTDYIHSQYGMSYTQDESYYILNAKENAGVYLGLKENIDPKQMISDLKVAKEKNLLFETDKYVNFFPAKKHDHYLIPAGTIHCSSQDCVVLEISATPYIFTYKLYDWGRVGLDGKPRPIHIDDGSKVIDWQRQTKWVEKNLINHFEVIEDNNDYKETKTGLHDLEFIETRVIESEKETVHLTNGEFQMLNLVEGSSIIIKTNNHQFSPFVVHYAETFIIPAGVKEYTISPFEETKEYKVLQAKVKNR